MTSIGDAWHRVQDASQLNVSLAILDDGPGQPNPPYERLVHQVAYHVGELGT